MQQHKQTYYLTQKMQVIDAIEKEMEHFTKAMHELSELSNRGSEAHQAYVHLIESYEHMIKVRSDIIKRLKGE